MSIRSTLSRTLVNLPGWHTKRKIVVIESDDWGAIGMPSPETYKLFLEKGINLDNNPYAKYDSLASEKDLIHLLETLSNYKDKNGKSPVFTLNTVVANPDFDKIESSDFSKYYFEPFTETLKRYPEHKNSFNLWQEGIKAGIFFPQFHAREHLNSVAWLKELKNKNNSLLKFAFKNRVSFLSTKINPEFKKFLNSAYLPNNSEEEEAIPYVIEDGLKIFKNIFGYSSESFIATGYIWSRNIEKCLYDKGIKFIQGLAIQREPQIGKSKFKRRFNYTGKKNKWGQIFLTRNVFFEPSLNYDFDWVSDSLKRINMAFNLHKPAVISSHRLNFIGFINEQNRIRNLKLLNILLTYILKNWPDVQFLTTVQLGKLMLNPTKEINES